MPRACIVNELLSNVFLPPFFCPDCIGRRFPQLGFGHALKHSIIEQEIDVVFSLASREDLALETTFEPRIGTKNMLVQLVTVFVPGLRLFLGVLLVGDLPLGPLVSLVGGWGLCGRGLSFGGSVFRLVGRVSYLCFFGPV